VSTLSWAEVMKRPDLVGGDLEIELADGWLRGPIRVATSFEDMAVLDLEWVAFRSRGETGWRADDADKSVVFFRPDWPLVVASDTYIELRPDRSRLRASGQAQLANNLIRRIYPCGTSRLDPAEVEGLLSNDGRPSNGRKLEMTPDEWIALCGPQVTLGEWVEKLRSSRDAGGEYEFPALPVCCDNVSAMRSAIEAVRGGGVVQPANRQRLLAAYAALRASHSSQDWDWTILNKLMEQVEPGCTAVTAPAE
jgi:hypothetical protein